MRKRGIQPPQAAQARAAPVAGEGLPEQRERGGKTARGRQTGETPQDRGRQDVDHEGNSAGEGGSPEGGMMVDETMGVCSKETVLGAYAMRAFRDKLNWIFSLGLALNF